MVVWGPTYSMDSGAGTHPEERDGSEEQRAQVVVSLTGNSGTKLE